ncbi:MFS transporter [Marinicrinis sediminis]|uniref:MFS transporter n=1 Tax=Marinicrinis sediminis TaxID=1652465 RepID=A0ABW5R906_9BACL
MTEGGKAGDAPHSQSNHNASGSRTVFGVLFTISMIHLLNDTMQSVVPAIFPIVKESLQLSYAQLGLIAFALNLTASLLQPMVGLYSDRTPRPYLLPLGMMSTFLGIVGMALASGFVPLLLSVVMVGIGSAVFHPESAKVAYLAAGSRRGLAQSIFQVGGNSGQALAPIMTALIFVPLGQFGIIWFTFAAGTAIVLQIFIARWYQQQLVTRPVRKKTDRKLKRDVAYASRSRSVSFAIFILIILITSKMSYHAAMTSFYAFYLMDHFQLTIQQAQWCIFSFLAAGAAGVFFGGPMADAWGRRNTIWFSILGSLPFILILPYLSLPLSILCFVLIGFTIMSSGSVIVVYAQELLPGRIGMVSGLFYGLSFGLGGLSAAAFGVVADLTSITLVIILSSLIPLIGLLTFLLPSDQQLKEWEAA